MRNKIINLTKSLLFNRVFLAALLLIVFSFNAKSQSGDIDLTFNSMSGADNDVSTIAIQSDGKIIIGGYFTLYSTTPRNRIARINVNGTLDATFNPGNGANDVVLTTAIQSDGKIIIGGGFSYYNNTPRKYVARLNAGGTLDATFNPGAGADNMVWTTTIQSDGKIIIGGIFTSYNGTLRNRIARLNADATLDTTFNPGTGTNDWVIAAAIQSDGKIIIGGDFTSYNGIPRNRIVRLNSDGTLDATFNPGTGANKMVWTTAIQSDGKIIIGGDFTSYNGTPRNRIARLNTDGTLDDTFNPGTGANSGVKTTAIQSDGKIIIGGDFTSSDGIPRNRIARLNTNGTLDETFNTSTGTSSYVLTTAIQSDGKIIIGGNFTSYDGTARNRVARLLNLFTGVENYVKPEAISIYPNPVSYELNIEIEGNIEQVNFEIFNSIGQVVFKGNLVEKTTIQTSNFEFGIYLIKLENGKVFEFKKIIKQ